MRTRSNDIRNRDAARRLRLLVVMTTPLLAAGALFLMNASPVRAATAIDPGLAALAAPRLKQVETSGANGETPIVVAKRSRLFSNGTRPRSSERSESKPEETDSQSPASPVRDITSQQMPADPAPAATPSAATSAASAPQPQSQPANSVTAVTGRNPTSSGAQCLANCRGPNSPTGTSQTTVFAGTQSSGAKPLTCVAGCNGLPTPMAQRQPSGPVAATASGLEASSGTSGNRITILRGATRTKVYSTGQ